MAVTVDAPQKEIGYARVGPAFNWWAYDGETTPELMWPQSVEVYDQMRTTDAQVGSVLRAVTLPVRRTPWRVDPNGAREEVTELVANDLGLPIVGKKPKSAPRMKDRFSWPEHLRQALLMLPFGHMYFEQTYRVTDNGSRAHLHKLGPRMPRTIEQITVARDGGLVSITQLRTLTDAQEQRPIPVNRLVAYINEREGGNWLGRSLLRTCYKNWLIKDRLLRVQAQTIERNGMGIPLYTDAENPEAGSLAKGLEMATAWRAGEAAGSAIPWGSTLRLVGVEGDLPDADPAIRYHDEQIARAVLAHFLNLGTQTGSWALGTTFADFFTLSLQTLAQQIADTATQHIVEDLVDVNFGEDEPSPRIVFDEIGSREEATAQAIKLLIDAGVITPDDVLEESTRQQYGLPPADPDSARGDPKAEPPISGGLGPTTPNSSPPSTPTEPVRVEAKFNPLQPRVPGGERGGEWTLTGLVRDLLNLGGRIDDMEPGEELLGSDKLKADAGTIRVALTDRGLRLGIGGENFGGREDEAGPWRAGRDQTAAVNAERAKLRQELDRLDELDSLTPEQEARYSEIEDSGFDDVYPSGYTARLDRQGVERLRSELSGAVEKAALVKAADDARWDEIERLEAEEKAINAVREPLVHKYRASTSGLGHAPVPGAPPLTPEEDAELDRLTARWVAIYERIDALKAESQERASYEASSTTGSVGGQWADIHYDVYFDDTEVHALLGATPHGSDLVFEDLDDQRANLDLSEARKLLRLLDRATIGDTRIEAAAFNPQLHPRDSEGKFRTTLDKIVYGLRKWAAGGGKGDPFEGFTREQLRRTGVQRGLTFRRGASEHDIRDALLENLRDALAGDSDKPVDRPGKKAAPKAAPDKVPAKDGWRPGGWKQVTAEEYRTKRAAEIAAEGVASDAHFEIESPAGYHAGMGARIAKREAPPGSVVLANGPHYVIAPSGSYPTGRSVRDDDELTPNEYQIPRAALAEAGDVLDALIESNPPPRPMRIVFTGRDSPVGKASTGDGGREIVLNTGWEPGETFDNGSGFVSWFMPAASDESMSKLRYHITHEYGHALMFQLNHGGAAHGAREANKDTLSPYGKTDHKEGYAEAFAEFFLSNGDTDNAAAQAYAEQFGWHPPSKSADKPSPVKKAPAKKAAKKATPKAEPKVAKPSPLADEARSILANADGTYEMDELLKGRSKRHLVGIANHLGLDSGGTAEKLRRDISSHLAPTGERQDGRLDLMRLNDIFTEMSEPGVDLDPGHAKGADAGWRDILDATPGRSSVAGDAQALHDYKSDAHFREVNDLLAGGDYQPGDNEIVDGVRASMAPTERDMIVWRGDRGLKRSDFARGEWERGGFASTSADESVARDFAANDDGSGTGQPVLMRIRVPAGTRAVAIDSVVEREGPDDIAQYLTEQEVLLDGGLRYRVTKDYGVVRGVRQVDVEVVPGEPSKVAKKDAPKAPARTAPPKVEPKSLDDLRELDAEAVRDALDLHTVPELKDMLRDQKLPLSGRKRELVDRLVEHLGGGKTDTTTPEAPKAPRAPKAAKKAAPKGGTSLTGQDALASPPRSLEALTAAGDPRADSLWYRSGDNSLETTTGRPGAFDMADQMRSRRVDPQMRARIRAIDSVMAESVLSQPVEVYRGFEPEAVRGENGRLVGKQFGDRSFVSTTTDPKHAAEFGGTVMRIRVPAGMRAIRMADRPGGTYEESEILLDRGLRFRVVAEHGRQAAFGGQYLIDVEIVQ